MSINLHETSPSLRARIQQQLAADAEDARVTRIARAGVPPRAAVSDTEPRERKETLASDSSRETPRPGLRHCRFTLRRKQLLDVDAKYASVKDLLDCLGIAYVIRGDKEGEITLEVNQEKIRPGETEQTVIEVFETTGSK